MEVDQHCVIDQSVRPARCVRVFDQLIRRRYLRLFVTAALPAILFGCSASSSPADGRSASLDIPSLDALPVGQQEAFADGQVDLREYSLAFASFSACARSRDAPLIDPRTDPATGLVTYGVLDGPSGPPLGTPKEPKLDGPIGSCWADLFSWIEFAFSLTDPNVRAQDEAAALRNFSAVVLPCLQENNSAPTSEITDVSSGEFSAALNSYDDLVAAGLC